MVNFRGTDYYLHEELTLKTDSSFLLTLHYLTGDIKCKGRWYMYKQERIRLYCEESKYPVGGSEFMNVLYREIRITDNNTVKLPIKISENDKRVAILKRTE
jgi:hypothetical protein